MGVWQNVPEREGGGREGEREREGGREGRERGERERGERERGWEEGSDTSLVFTGEGKREGHSFEN